MYAGKILKILVLATAFFTAGSLYLPGVSLAGDVWCYSCSGRSFYLDSESINADDLPRQMDYRVAVKAVLESDGSLEKIIIYGFESQNDILVGSIFDKTVKQWVSLQYARYTKEKPVLKAVWEAMKPYMKQKRISYSDSWAWK